MADRMRVTSLIGGTEKLEWSRRNVLPNSWGGSGNHRPWSASNLLRRPAFSPRKGTADEYTIRLAGGPRAGAAATDFRGGVLPLPRVGAVNAPRRLRERGPPCLTVFAGP